MSDNQAQSEKPHQPPRWVRVFGALLAAVLVLFALLGGVWWFAKARAKARAELARAQWKGPALERLASLTVTNEEILQELHQLRTPTPQLDFGWAHHHVLLMTNGEFIIYAFRHGANNGFVDHLFLGHGSDGRWLYSTYHFCSSMGVLGVTTLRDRLLNFQRDIQHASLMEDQTSV